MVSMEEQIEKLKEAVRQFELREEALTARLEDKELHMQALWNRLHRREAELAEMRYSTSWRITHPLRKVATASPRLKQAIKPILRVLWWLFTLRLPQRVWQEICRNWHSRSFSQKAQVFGSEWYKAKNTTSSLAPLLTHLRGRGNANRQQEKRIIRHQYSDWNREREAVFRQDIKTLYNKNPEKYDGITVSVVMPTWNRGDIIGKAIESVQSQTHKAWELHIVDDGSTDTTEEIIRGFMARDARIYYHKQPKSGVSSARNKGITDSIGTYIFYLDSDNTWLPDYLHTMLVAMEGGNISAAYSSIEAKNDKGETDFYRGDDFDWENCYQGNYVDLNCFGHHRHLTDSGERFDETFRRLVDWDFILRLTAYHRTCYLPFLGVQYYNGDGGNRISNTEYQTGIDTLRDAVRAKHMKDDFRLRNAPENRPDWGEIHWGLQPRRIGIKIPAPYDKRMEWGDYHYAESLKHALEKMEHTVKLDFHQQWDKRPATEDEIVIVIRGLVPYTPKPEHINILWNISHPDQVGYDEYESYDLVCVASLSFAILLREIIKKPVLALLQATDISRFHPWPAEEQKQSDVLFVGNSRNEYRTIVRWAVEAGAKLSVYGTRWNGLIPADFIKGENIDNTSLSRYYAGAKAVLNDHWAAMREYGLISNRIFDVLASGGRLISDSCASITRLFGAAVEQVDNAEDAKRAMHNLNKEPVDRNAIAAYISRRHSFDARATSLVHAAYRMLGGHYPNEVDDAWMAQPYAKGRRPLSVNIIIKRGFSGPQSSAYIRLISPLSCDALSGKVDLAVYFDDNWRNMRRADVCIVQRTAVSTRHDVADFLQLLQQYGARLVVDNDDAFTLLGPSHPEFAEYSQRNVQMKALMQAADQVWMSTKPLADVYSEIKTPMYVVENTLDARMWRDYRQERIPIGHNKKCQIVYMGTATHDGDFALIFPALERLASQYPDRFELTIIGAVRHPPERKWIKIAKPPKDKALYPKFVRWFLQQGPFDIGLAPLAESSFNVCKSDIKFLDYVGLGILPILSDVPAYQGDAKTRNLALIATNTPDGWYETLENALTTLMEKQAIVSRAWDYVWQERHCAVMAEQQLGLLQQALDNKLRKAA